MTHIHTCPHCPSVRRCSDACPIDAHAPLVSSEHGPVEVAHEHRICSECEKSIADVDALPNPERGPLAISTLVRIVARGTRAALRMAATDPESAPGELARYVDPMSAKDSTRQDPDTWARCGAVCGAKDGWSGAAYRLPPDVPRGEATAAYVCAWSSSAAVVMQIRMEVGKC